MRAWGGDQVAEAVASSVELLRTVTDKDWTGVKAGRLDWTCRQTAEHMAGDLLAYAGQLAGRAQTAYAPFELGFDEGTDQAGVLDVIETTGALLTATVRTTPPRVRAFHPYPFRSANREGFAAMGIAEVLLHTHDIAEGLGLAYEPPAELCASVLTRIFPHVRPGPEPWPTLLWATGRGDLPGRAPVTEWRWNNNLVLPTERLTLEGITPAAAADLVAGGDGGFVWLGDAPFEGTRDVAAALLKAYDDGVHRPEFGALVLVRREDGRAVGSLVLHGMPDEEGRTEIGYDLVEPARGHGYATEALTALADWALARDDVHLLYAAVEEANSPSQGVLTRAGFTRADVTRETLLEDETLRLYTRRG
ncbi:GNAT family N-acetyltransferase [Streptomyces phaeoluteigriseus]|uniref:GNAT family N-acetyltransferase n=1 Tax=Streptomyces phaeoluteigriseus TaxID=114686 RepID=A0A1V6MU48_9ACTN|nr:GNAT family N-acetyltransferase [Streptomyces phaeoluteigriseus]OQD55882.1 GNAT family N-acetyltransferase [Streptomyces phaeoluteigriseus]